MNLAAIRAKALHGKQEVPLTDLMSPDFIAACSLCSSLEELFTASPFEINTMDDFKAIPDAD